MCSEVSHDIESASLPQSSSSNALARTMAEMGASNVQQMASSVDNCGNADFFDPFDARHVSGNTSDSVTFDLNSTDNTIYENGTNVAFAPSLSINNGMQNVWESFLQSDQKQAMNSTVFDSNKDFMGSLSASATSNGQTEFSFGVESQNNTYGDLPFMGMDWSDSTETLTCNDNDNLLPLMNRLMTAAKIEKTNEADDDLIVNEYLNFPHEINNSNCAKSAVTLAMPSYSASFDLNHHSVAQTSNSYLQMANSDFDWCDSLLSHSNDGNSLVNGTANISSSATAAKPHPFPAKCHDVLDLFDSDSDLHSALDFDTNLERMLVVSTANGSS